MQSPEVLDGCIYMYRHRMFSNRSPLQINTGLDYISGVGQAQNVGYINITYARGVVSCVCVLVLLFRAQNWYFFEVPKPWRGGPTSVISIFVAISEEHSC